ncbi:hypothetical protein BCR44DRAFT_1022612 [Catenaria anguillulae PL171]|uniref:Amine oxidase domain-containing protein n=1 Tax=Catenaria anguillulae PL171 TaxID=765915 RepID=A0A1Y2H632_9FUNG|nr:hypothetical protein BCR44DRAFT_1022612 [Catenaria anguillulae PL171]
MARPTTASQADGATRIEPIRVAVADYAGGHTHTVDVPPLKEFASNPRVKSVPVDTGFIVLNPVTYPTFLRFLDQLNVPLTKSDMSFAVSRDLGEFEWAGDTLMTLFAQTRNLVDFSRDGMWIMLWDVLRFHWVAAQIADAADKVTFSPQTASDDDRTLFTKYKDMSIGDFLIEGAFSPSFRDNFLVPQTAAIWSTPAGSCIADFPILRLISFFRNHRMLQLVGRPRWLTVALGSREYVKRITQQLPDVRLRTAIRSVTRIGRADGRVSVNLTDVHGSEQTFDHVILATHGDISRQLIQDPSTEETEVLSKVRYTKNRAVLHRDPALMPKTRATWSSWNYLTSTGKDGRSDSSDVCVTYWMNRLQPFIPRQTHGDIFLTINPLYEPDPTLVIDEYEYDHPVYDFDLVQAQEQLHTISNKNGIGFAGAWENYCFHEDGCTSGLSAATALGATPPFDLHLNGGYPTHRKLQEPVPGFPLVPNPDEYLSSLGHLLPVGYTLNSRKHAVTARPWRPRTRHVVDMSVWQVALQTLILIIGHVTPKALVRQLPRASADCFLDQSRAG